ncbi:MAG: ABC transporter permease [Flavobacterium sp.]|nr:MAG: ABC transporter permease [Flavobacterium sp.]
MFKLNLKIALRNIWKHKLTTSIKLIGLVVGLSTVVVLVSYVIYEMSYDTAFKNSTQLYRIQAVDQINGKERIGLPSGLGAMLKNELPEITEECQVNQMDANMKVGDGFYNEVILEADSSFISMFSPVLLEGNRANPLSSENEILISESFAKKAFHNKGAINQILQFQGYEGASLIVGVFKDFPSASHLQPVVIRKSQFKNVLNWGSYTSRVQYVRLKNTDNPDQLQTKIAALYKKYKFPKEISLKLLPISKIHLYSHASDEISVNSDIKYIYIFSIVALLILAIAIINFVNLTVAASLKRAKEIGVKKVMGASRTQLATQFLCESYIYFVISALLVLVLAHDFIPVLGKKLNIDISLNEIISSNTVLISIFVVLIAGFIAGLYPALILSKLNPVKTLKGSVANPSQKYNLKRGLIVFQFGASAFLIICTFVINGQINFIREKKLGFDTDQILVSSFNFFRDGDGGFRKDLQKIPGVKSLTMSTFSPGSHYGSASSWTNGKDTTRYEFDFIHADLNFINTLKIPVLKGRAFSAKYGTDVVSYKEAYEKLSQENFKKLLAETPIMLNEAAVKSLQLKNPVDTLLNYDGLQGRVIGVVRDFNGMSLHNQVKPLVIKCESKMNYGYMFIKIDGNNLVKIRADIDKLWRERLPNEAPTFQFVDQQIQKLYLAEIRLGMIFSSFAAIAIFLCLIGLFGMIYFELEQKTKEIAVRKILGATLKDLLTMLNGSFAKLVLLANLIIWPLAYMSTKKWLATFSYSADYSYLPFVYALLVSLLLTVLIVSLQSIRILKKSPVKALKYE